MSLRNVALVAHVDHGKTTLVDGLLRATGVFAAHQEQLSFPVISAVSREGRAVVGVGLPSEDADLAPVLDAVLEHIPAPDGDPDAPLQALVTNLDASDYLGRLAVGRVVQGTLRKGDQVVLLKDDDTVNP